MGALEAGATEAEGHTSPHPHSGVRSETTQSVPGPHSDHLTSTHWTSGNNVIAQNLFLRYFFTWAIFIVFIAFCGSEINSAIVII